MYRLGAFPQADGVTFRVWAPNAERVDLMLEDGDDPRPMTEDADGYFSTFAPGVQPGARYRYRLDGVHTFPDPASRHQPDGVHGPSAVVDPDAYTWQDGGWSNVAHRDLVFYELHVGTFTPEGTFEGVRRRLPYLKDLGITAVELMPLADFPGRWGWGYDPAAFYAPARAYGTPDDLRALVDEAHRLGLAVFLDVIYNHLGPDGAYVAAYAPMFTDRHHTPWGSAINLDDEGSTGVRHFFIDNALHWLREYHFDGLRLDATHALQDDSDQHFLSELADAVAALDEGPRRYLIAEDARNLNTLILPKAQGGYGLDGLWADDFHHQIRNLTAGDRDGYYASFAGTTAADLARTIRQGWFFDGQIYPHWGTPRGTDASDIEPEQCVFCIQNHDQTGNRPLGNRLTDDIPLPVYRAATALLLFVPELPLLFMGQEWAATTPFRFFSDHHEELGKLVTAGRKEEFKHFEGFRGDVPDPQHPETFDVSRLDWRELEREPHRHTLHLYRDLLRLRPDLGGPLSAEALGSHALAVRRGPHTLFVTFEGETEFDLPDGSEVAWHSEEAAYAPDPQPPQLADGAVYFPRAGALVLRER